MQYVPHFPVAMRSCSVAHTLCRFGARYIGRPLSLYMNTQKHSKFNKQKKRRKYKYLI